MKLIYVTSEGFDSFIDDGGYTWDDTAHPHTDAELFDVERRILAYIIPNTPRTVCEKSAFCAAVYSQLVFEASLSGGVPSPMPSGMTSFTVNGFSATFGNGIERNNTLPFGLDMKARALLLDAGLLYKGVI